GHAANGPGQSQISLPSERVSVTQDPLPSLTVRCGDEAKNGFGNALQGWRAFRFLIWQLVVSGRLAKQLGRSHDCSSTRLGTAGQGHQHRGRVETSHLAGSQTKPDARGTVRRVRACIFPHEGVYRARAAIGLKEGDNALPAEGGDERLIRPYGAEICDVLLGSSRRDSRHDERRVGDGSGT